MKNLYDLREKLIGIFAGIEDGSLDLAKAKTMTNTAGKIIGTVKTQINYHVARSERPEIAFVGDAAGAEARGLAEANARNR